MSLDSYTFTQQLTRLWEHGLQAYRSGERTPQRCFDADGLAWIDWMGATPQEVFDFIEDFADRGDPDFTTFALLADIRRHYFQNRQQGRREPDCDPEQLPAKAAELHGVPWLPRIIEKARCKLHGTLGPDIMYTCGGDRAFLQRHGLHAAQFLRVVEDNEHDTDAIVAWFLAHVQARGAVGVE